ncbi:Hsp70 family protein [Saprospira grandis]|uniref:Hsp70 family protein n=1 Tax=Saprospira grandis TaxID=1008 RepID=UPI0022DDB63D|nr:Hsp70 family protein [Saprospira grandis]WBM74522.1 Hsp70 family protein [Saprospira grandis]
MQKVIGIDLGTTNSVMAYKVLDTKILPNIEKEENTPSVVHIDSSGQASIGKIAVDSKLALDPKNTVFSAKRLMGMPFSHPMVQEMVKESKKNDGYYKYSIRKKHNSEDALAIVLHGREYSPEDISAEVLRKIKRDAESHLGDKVSHAVITVPAYFNDKQKNATKKAAEKSGLIVSKLLAEPTAAAIAYGVDQKTEESKTILVYDFGGGTFDLSVLTVANGLFMEQGTGGDRWLGGDDIDRLLSQHIYQLVENEFDLEEGHIHRFLENAPEKTRFAFAAESRKQVERIKKDLSKRKRSHFELDDLLEDEEGDLIDIDIEINRTDFEDLIRPTIAKTIRLIDDLLAELNYEENMIDAILLVGGSSRIPLVNEMLMQRFGAAKVQLSEDPMNAVAKGAAILAHRLGNSGELEQQEDWGEEEEEFQVLYSSSHDIYVRLEDENGQEEFERVVERQIPLPIVEQREYKTAADQQRLIKVELFSNKEEGGKEEIGLGFLVLEEDYPANSSFIFHFEVDTDNTLKLLVAPKNKPNQKSEIHITRGNKDQKFYRTIDEEINNFNRSGANASQMQKLQSDLVKRLKATNQLAQTADDDSQLWDKHIYEVKEEVAQAQHYQEESSHEPADSNMMIARILLNNYENLIGREASELIRMLLQKIELENDILAIQQARQKLEELISNFMGLLDLFLFIVAANRAKEKGSMSDSRRLRDIHDQAERKMERGQVDEGFAILNEHQDLRQKYLGEDSSAAFINTSLKR